jgi:hypothetical protein
MYYVDDAHNSLNGSFCGGILKFSWQINSRVQEGQPAHTASGEDGTTGKNRPAKTPL